jgi:lysophospholipase L1-like esterase
MNRRRRRWKSRKAKKTPWWVPLVIILLIPLGVELLARLGAKLGLFGQELELQASTPDQPSLEDAYQLQFLTASGQDYGQNFHGNHLPPGQLLAQRHPLLGYSLLPSQENRFWLINSQGFRDDGVLDLQKPGDEIRIFILGGSTAFGQLSTSNQVLFSSQLQASLNQQIANQRADPDDFQPPILPYRADEVDDALALKPRIRSGQYRIINAAVPGYGSGNILARLIHQVAAYQPDLLIVISGYADLLLPSEQFAADIPHLDTLLESGPLEVQIDTTPWTENLWQQFYLVKIFRAYSSKIPELQPQEPLRLVNFMTPTSAPPLTPQLATDEAELAKRIARYRQNLQQMVYWASATKKRLLVILPPEISGRETLTPAETKIVEDLGDAYGEKMAQAYGQLAQAAQQVTASSANAKVLDFYQLYESFEPDVFHDPVSLTDEAQGVLADSLFEAIVAEYQLEPEPFSGFPGF